MAAKRDYYEVLNIPRASSASEIKSAYRKLARELHPDKNKAPDAAKRFSELQEAYDVLSDADKRRQYDQFGHAAPGFGGSPGAGGGRYSWSNVGGPGGSGSPDFADSDFSSVFEEIFGGGGPNVGGGGFGGFGRSTGHGPGTRAKPGRSRDTAADIEVDFTTAALGGKRSIRVDTGSGTPRELEVTIPRAFKDGGKLRVRGAGAPGARGGPAGDLILTVHVAAHPLFKRNELDILLELPLTIAEASLGARLHVPTPTGSIELSVPPGTSSGQKLRVRGQGLKDDSGATGDFYAIARIIAPKSLDEESRRALEELSKKLDSPRSDGLWRV